MWICPTCGEPHQDHFKQCWKCVGAEMEEHVTAEAPKPAPLPAERHLRSMSSILLRAGVGFLLGFLLSLSSCNFLSPQSLFPGQDLSTASHTVVALVIGALFGILVGLFFWVMFPYEPRHEPKQANETDS